MTARAPKPAWADVPEALREKLSLLLGEPIADGEIVWGGYGPSATFVLTTPSGRRVFCKGTHPGQTELGHRALLSERLKYEGLPELAQFGPAYLGGADHESWHMALLEFVAPGHAVPPWTDETAEQALRLLVAFHAAAPERAAHELEPFAKSVAATNRQSWRSLQSDAPSRARFAALFEDEGLAQRWFDRHIETVTGLEAQAAATAGPQSWLHMDIRSDNLVFARDGRLFLVDWPMLVFGPVIIDIAGFLPSVEGEGGPGCADMLRRYETLAGKAFDPSDVAKAVAYVSGYFAARAGEAAIAGLPRLRWIQKLQLFPALRWLCELAGIEAPPVPCAFEP